jgi:hypothetical protein
MENKVVLSIQLASHGVWAKPLWKETFVYCWEILQRYQRVLEVLRMYNSSKTINNYDHYLSTLDVLM